MRNAPITELIGPKNGMAKAKNHITSTTGTRAAALYINLLL